MRQDSEVVNTESLELKYLAEVNSGNGSKALEDISQMISTTNDPSLKMRLSELLSKIAKACEHYGTNHSVANNAYTEFLAPQQSGLVATNEKGIEQKISEFIEQRDAALGQLSDATMINENGDNIAFSDVGKVKTLVVQTQNKADICDVLSNLADIGLVVTRKKANGVDAMVVEMPEGYTNPLALKKEEMNKLVEKLAAVREAQEKALKDQIEARKKAEEARIIAAANDDHQGVQKIDKQWSDQIIGAIFAMDKEMLQRRNNTFVIALGSDGLEFLRETAVALRDKYISPEVSYYKNAYESLSAPLSPSSSLKSPRLEGLQLKSEMRGDVSL